MGVATFRGMSTPVDASVGHPALVGCARIGVILDGLIGTPGTDPSSGASALGDCDGEGVALWSASDDELVDLVRATDALAARMAGLRARAVAQCAARDLPAATASCGGTAWLSGVLTARPARAKALWHLAADLHRCAPATAAALGAGQVDEDRAHVIARAVVALPAEVPPDVRAAGEAYLLEQAATLNAAALTHLANRLLDVIAPDVAEAKLGEQLAREEAVASRVSLTAADDRHGMVSVRGRFDVESWAFVAAALEPLAAPRPTGRSRSLPGSSTETDTGADKGAGAEVGSDGDLDLRPYSRRLGEALVELARRALDTGALPASGTSKPHLVLTIGIDALRRKVGAAVLDTGQSLSVAAVRRLGCDASIGTVLLDPTGHPLDVGRTQRLFTGPIRRALVLRDRGCAFPGCTRPPAWCEGHHIVHWIDGGHTSLANGVLLCRAHHRVLHRGHWSVAIGADGRPWFTPPAWIDLTRTARTNRSHLRL